MYQVMDYIQLVERDAQKIANDCWMNDWRHWLANRDIKFGKKSYPDRCECGNGSFILRANHIIDPCDKCIPCTRCGIGWQPNTQTKSIHGPLGDYEHWKPVYLAKVIPRTWYDHKKAEYLIGWQDFLRPDVPKMTENTAIHTLQMFLHLYPEIGAWVTLELLYTAINLRWKKMVILATHLLERRQTWFTPTGLYASMAETDTYTDDRGMGRVDLPLTAENGPYCPPRYLSCQDRSTATINLDHSICGWLDSCAPDDKASLINVLSRALACSVAQWGIEECESFHREEQQRILGIVAHDDKRSWTSVYVTPSSPTVYWHSQSSIKCCPRCKQDTVQQDSTQNTQRTPYEDVLYSAKLIRQRRLRGVFWCAIQMATSLYRERSFVPGKGWRYFQAFGDFNKRRDSLH
jgi:hypothetical protein